MIVVNFKNYKYGNAAVQLARKVKRCIPNAIVSVPASEIREVSKKVKIAVFAQHVDPYKTERGTGYVLAEVVKKAGACGTIINHSEHKVKLSHLSTILKICFDLKLKVLACADSVREAKKILRMQYAPWGIAFEDPRLISTGKSVTQYNSKSLKKFLKVIEKREILPFCGAGISTEEDVMQAYEMGFKGVLIASAIAKVENPERLLAKIK